MLALPLQLLSRFSVAPNLPYSQPPIFWHRCRLCSLQCLCFDALGLVTGRTSWEFMSNEPIDWSFGSCGHRPEHSWHRPVECLPLSSARKRSRGSGCELEFVRRAHGSGLPIGLTGPRATAVRDLFGRIVSHIRQCAC